MKRQVNIPELLAPARDREAFLAAVAAGADAIYCGVAGGLNARRKAAGISEDELPELCVLAHAHGTRVYVTTNIVVKQDELAGAVASVSRYAAAGADAFILQDWGLMAELRRALPEAELHVSTQANIHDTRGVRFCEELGAARVTLSRELPLSEIAALARDARERAAARDGRPCELEVFAHGAICPSYSGVCMLSSFLREGRSPNRGLCAQPCRLPFDLVGEEGIRLQPAERERPLCTHDNCAIDDAHALAAAGVASLKLEGRMKPAAYVHAVTSAWRAELDALVDGEHGARPGEGYETGAHPAAGREPGAHTEVEHELGVRPVAGRRRALKRSFNRGLTDAYLHGTSGNELMSYERSGNRGELVGEVVGFVPEPGFVPRDGQSMRGETLVQLVAPVEAGDSIELRPLDDPARFMVVEVPRDAAAGEVLRCPTRRPMPEGAEARVTRSVALERTAAQAVEALERETGALVHETAQVAGALECGDVGAFAQGAGVLERSEAGALVQGASASVVSAGSVASAAVPARDDVEVPHCELCALVARPEDAEALRAAGAQRVYLDVSGSGAASLNVEAARVSRLIPVLDEVCREPDHARLDPWICAGEPVAVGNTSELALARERGARAELRSCIPVHNVAALRMLARAGARGVWLSPELSLDEIRELAQASRQSWSADIRAAAHIPMPHLGLMVYGRPRLMTCEHCVLQVAYDCDRNHERCPYRRRAHWLVNIDGRRLPVRTDARGRSRVYLDEPLDLTEHVHELVAAGVACLLVDATTTSVEDAAAVLRRLAGSYASGTYRAGIDGLLRSGVA